MSINTPKLEEEVIKNWRQIRAFERSVSKRPKSKNFVFYEGPPTANGEPGLHHVEARSFKDVVCRYKTMQGYRVERRAGWDTHGLPVELQVEKELGLNNKKEIEDYGIAKFNEKCRKSVWKYQQNWENLTERMGFWIDMDNPYITYKPLYIESLWSIIKTAWEKGLLEEGHKVVPKCTRCGTGLSSHEVSLGYEDVTEESVFVKFRVKGSPPSLKLRRASQKVYFLAWTTTPWTLPGNVALAVGKNIKYSIVKQGSEYYVLATDRLDVLESDYEIVEEVQGKDIEGLEYEPLFDIKEVQSKTSHKVYSGNFVSTDEGTGIVHTSVMYGEDDYELGEKEGLPKVHTVDENGKFNELVSEFEGQFVKDADPAIIDRLRAENLLYKTMEYEHTYPFCWRCGTPLIYYAMHSWFMRMRQLRDRMAKANQKVNWIPDYIKDGRFGEWLNEVKDWAFSRSRYWGTPLPVWRCDTCDNLEVVGSRKDIKDLYKTNNTYYLLRHATSYRNAKDVLNSVYPDKEKLGLTSEGKKEAKSVAGSLDKKGGVDMIIASPLARTKETAEIVGENLGVSVEYDKRVLELNAGIFEGGPVDTLRDYFTSQEERFTKAPPKGENLAQIQRRMLSVVKELEKKYKDKRILIISHGDPLWLLESAAGGLTIDEAIKRREKIYPEKAGLRKISYTQFPYNKHGELDFHRPHIDKLTFSCNNCDNGTLRRVHDLVDVWFDSGAMPFAQQHYPFENKAKIDGNEAPNRSPARRQARRQATGSQYPADFITEAVDQTRGWFYTLLAVATLMDREPSYKNVISMGIVLDEKGQKMSKSKGNIVDPNYLANTYGMDALRWYFYTVNGPGEAKRFSERDIQERWKKFISTFLNSYTFLKTYSDKKPDTSYKPSSSGNILDVWIYAKLKEVSRSVADYMDNYNILDASRLLNEFLVEDVSNWYIRRSRSRLQRGGDKKDKEEAAKTLAFVLNELSKLTASFVPFISEFVWQGLNNTNAKSVHWEDFPNFKKPTKKEKEALATMENIREWAQIGLRLRSQSGVPVRQPLPALFVPEKVAVKFSDVLKDELNVKEVKTKEDESMKEGTWVKEDVKGKVVALRTDLSEQLVREGKAREMVRRVQGLRKNLGFKPDEKIEIVYSLPESLFGVLVEFEERIANDTNAKRIQERKVEGSSYDGKAEFKWDAKRSVELGIRKVKN